MPREDAFAEDGLTHSPNGPFSPESLPYPISNEGEFRLAVSEILKDGHVVRTVALAPSPAGSGARSRDSPGTRCGLRPTAAPLAISAFRSLLWRSSAGGCRARQLRTSCWSRWCCPSTMRRVRRGRRWRCATPHHVHAQAA
jgi:hypothetical protein